VFQKNDGRRHDSEMEPQGRISSPFHTRLGKTTPMVRVHVQTVGLNAETKNLSALCRRGDFSLDNLFYRTSAVDGHNEVGLTTSRVDCFGVHPEQRSELRRPNANYRMRFARSNYRTAAVVQSAGGNAMRQKLGAGRVNSSATLGGPVRSLFTETTRHSCCSPLFLFCSRSLCLGTTISVKATSAPWALTTSVCVLS
jgi:hypothetical protein